MMSHSSKKQRLEGHHPTSAVATDNDFSPSFDDLSVDLHANILCFLPVEEIMRSRRINKKSMEAVKKTIFPLIEFRVDSVGKYNAMNVMTKAMPNLQRIELSGFGGHESESDESESDDYDPEHKYNNGEDPNERWAARTADYTQLTISE